MPSCEFSHTKFLLLIDHPRKLHTMKISVHVVLRTTDWRNF